MGGQFRIKIFYINKMQRQRKYVCQSIVFYQRDNLLNKVLKDAEDNYRGLEYHGSSIQKATKEMFIKFNSAKFADQKKFIETDSVGVFSMMLDLIENVSLDKPLMAYVLPTLDAIISENQKQFKQFMRAINPQIVPKLKSFLFLEGYESSVYEAAAKIITMIIAEEPKEGKEWIVLLVGGIGNKDGSGQSKIKISDPMIMPIMVYLLKHESLSVQFMRSGGIKIISSLLTNYPTDLQVAYYTILGLWLLTYSAESHAYFNDPALGLIRLTIEAIQKISREKVLRVAFATFRSLCDASMGAIELMVDSGLIKVIDLLLKGNLKDQDVIDDIKYVGDILEKNMKILSSFEKYVKELQAQHLQWSPVHSEKFWKENVKKFEENDFLLIRKISELLLSDNKQTVAIACYDLGEFCRFHPFGKNVLDGLNAKAEIMLHNWQVA